MKKYLEWLMSDEARLLWIYAPNVFDDIATDKAKEYLGDS